MKEILTVISLVIGVLSSGFSLSLIIIRPFRNWILGIKKEKALKDERENDQRETDKCLLRDRILHTYYKQHSARLLHCYEYENVARMYAQYKKLGGNSFVDRIWNEMQEWEIVE